MKKILKSMIRKLYQPAAILPAAPVFEPASPREIQQFCEWTYRMFGILDNPYHSSEDAFRWGIWDRQAKRIIARVKRQCEGVA